MSFTAVVCLFNVYSLRNKQELSFLDETFVACSQDMIGINAENAKYYLWKDDLELESDLEVAFEFVRYIEFHVSFDELSGVVFQEINDGLCITNESDSRLYSILRSLFEYEINTKLDFS